VATALLVEQLVGQTHLLDCCLMSWFLSPCGYFSGLWLYSSACTHGLPQPVQTDHFNKLGICNGGSTGHFDAQTLQLWQQLLYVFW